MAKAKRPARRKKPRRATSPPRPRKKSVAHPPKTSTNRRKPAPRRKVASKTRVVARRKQLGSGKRASQSRKRLTRDPRFEAAVREMNRGRSLTASARESQVPRKDFEKYLAQRRLRRRKGRRWTTKDTRPRRVPVMTRGRFRILTVRGYESARLVGEHHNTIGEFVRTNDIGFISPFRGQAVQTITGRKYPLETILMRFTGSRRWTRRLFMKSTKSLPTLEESPIWLRNLMRKTESSSNCDASERKTRSALAAVRRTRRYSSCITSRAANIARICPLSARTVTASSRMGSVITCLLVQSPRSGDLGYHWALPSGRCRSLRTDCRSSSKIRSLANRRIHRSKSAMKPRFVTPIAVRAYSERSGRKPLGSRLPSANSGASEWTLVFDCETTVDAAQTLRFGGFQVRNGEILEREGFFFDATTITPGEEATIRAYVDARCIELLTIAEFRSGVFLKYGYVRQGMVVGFNLPFDISRIAVSHGSARREMRGGFSFDLTGNSEDPRVRVKHLSPRAALIDFGVPGEQETTRAWRNRGMRVPAYRGHFVDIKTLASALLSRRFRYRRLRPIFVPRHKSSKQTTTEL